MPDAMDEGRTAGRNDANDPARRSERERIGIDIAARLSDRGVSLTGEESSEELVTLLEALERFERAVQAKGGDLMVDEGPADAELQPDNPNFVLPRRTDDESVRQYVRRIEEATGAID